MPARRFPRVIAWLAFVALVTIWGSGFAFTRIGLEEIPPITFVLYRVAFGAAAVAGWTLVSRSPQRPLLLLTPGLIILGLINMAGTFVFIAWGQQFVPSGVASILVGTVPVFAIMIAVAARHERLTLGVVSGVGVAFLGVVVLFSSPEDLTMEAAPGQALLGSLAIVGSALAIAACAVYASHLLRRISVVQILLAQLVVSLPALFLGAVLFERPGAGLIVVPQTLAPVIAIAWMGILGAGVANLMFYWLLGTWGVTRTTLITYAMPIVGVALGVGLLREALDARVVLATVLVVSGVVIVHTLAPTLRAPDGREARHGFSLLSAREPTEIEDDGRHDGPAT